MVPGLSYRPLRLKRLLKFKILKKALAKNRKLSYIFIDQCSNDEG
jgi:hypothetical protein